MGNPPTDYPAADVRDGTAPHGGKSPMSAMYISSRISVLSAIQHALPVAGGPLGHVLTAPSK